MDGTMLESSAAIGTKTPTTVGRGHGTLTARVHHGQEKKAGWAGSSTGAGRNEIFGEAQSAYFDGAVAQKEVRGRGASQSPC